MDKHQIFKALCYYLPYGFKCRIGKDNTGYLVSDFTADRLGYINKNDKYDEFKIIGLKKPKDITLSEIKEAAKLFIGGEIFDVHEKSVTMIHHLRGGPDVYHEFSLQKFFRGEYGLESLEWILSNGFDIFGLIDLGFVSNED